MGQKIPMISAYRLAAYAAFLEEMEKKGLYHVSSRDIAEGVGSTSAKVRKDLSYFGDFGKRGVGYHVADLHLAIKSILGTNMSWKTVVIGAGHLGLALASYSGFANRGFNIQAVFDNHPDKIGQSLKDIPILDVLDLKDYLEKEAIDIVIIASPASAAEEIGKIIDQTSVRGVLNFAPISLSLNPTISYRQLDLSVEMEVLSFSILHGQNLGLE